ncbi:amino acid adenylation domain-containing protein [Lachnotalea sp. AF33-28]|nr:amino acid adenylation domain-containing protein [Lachnotalea sp. AF33-28]
MLLFEYLLRKSIAKALEKSYNKNRMIMYRYEKGRSLIVKRTTESYPLSGSQRNIWGLEQHYRGTSINNICQTIRIRGTFDIALLQQCLNLLLESDGSLRAQIVLDEEGNPVQYQAEYETQQFPVFDFSTTNQAGIEHWEYSVTREVMPVLDAPLYYFAIIKISEQEGGVLLKTHHLISDGWSQVSLINKLAGCYLDLISGREAVLKPAPGYDLHVRAQADYIGSKAFIKDKKYWEEIMKNAGSPAALKECSSAAVSSVGRRKTFCLPDVLCHALTAFCGEMRVAPFVPVYMVLAVYLKRMKGAGRFCIGAPVHNRTTYTDRETTGMFVSTLPFLNELDEEKSFHEFIAELSETWLEMLRHQRFPYEEIQKIARKQNPSVDRLFDVVLSFQNSRVYENSDASLHFSGQWHYAGYQAEQICIHLINIEDSRRYTIHYDYLTQVFSEKEIEALHHYLMNILSHALAEPEIPIWKLSVMDSAEKELVLYTYNRTERPVLGGNIYRRFARECENCPGRVAVISDGVRYTYDELKNSANLLSWELARRIPGGGRTVAVLLPKGFPLLQAMIACAQSDNAWMLLADSLPEKRMEEILTGSGAALLITDAGHMQLYESAAKICPVLLTEEIDSAPVSMLESHAGPHDIAYLVYTSGSTGEPKGVEIEHESFVNFADAMAPCYAHGAVLSICSVGFDAFLLESVAALLNGRTVVLPGKEEQDRPDKLAGLIMRYAVGFLAVTPSRLSSYMKNEEFCRAAGRLEVILCGGEPFPAALLKELQKTTGARILNQYGPSETTVGVSYAELNQALSITVGKPMPNCRMYVLDSHLKPLPVGVSGDLYIGGVCVGRGYRNAPDLTAQAFMESPFEIGERLYRTGDVAAWNFGGEIVINGRADGQVKLRGLRIETEEVASRLEGHPMIGRAAVRLKRMGEQPVLTAYYTSPQPIEDADLMEFAATYLPDYMIPSVFIHMDDIPLSANGKVDERALPAPMPKSRNAGSETENQKKITEVFKQVLGCSDMKAWDDYFQMGGDSLNAVESLTQLEKLFGVRLRVADLYACRTAENLERRLGLAVKENRTSLIIPKAPEMEDYPLSPVQKSIYFQSMRSPDSLAYHMPGAFWLNEDVQPERLKEAFVRLVNSVELFRTAFVAGPQGVRQKICDRVEFELEEFDCADRREAKVRFLRPFQLDKPPLLHAALVRDKEKPLLLIDFHHLVGDGLSMPAVLRRLSEYCGGREPEPESITYKDYCCFLEHEGKSLFEEQREYWKQAVADLPEPVLLPCDYKRPKQFNDQGGKVILALDFALGEGLESFCKEMDITPYMLFAGTFAFLLYKLTDESDQVTGIPVSGRFHPGLKDIIGPFLNTLPLRIRVNGEWTVREYLQHVKEQVIGLMDHQDLPLEEILSLAQVKRSLNRNPLYNTMVSMRPVDSKSLEFGGRKLETDSVDTHTSKLDLSLEIYRENGVYYLGFEYAAELFGKRTVEMYSRSCQTVLEQILKNDGSRMSDLNPVSPEDAYRLFEVPGCTCTPFLDLPLDRRMETSAARNPGRTAIVCNGRKLSFGWLKDRSDALAHCLADAGAKRGSRIGLMCRRTPDMLASLFAIMKTGGAYVPMLSDYPAERIRYIAQNSGMSLLLCDESAKGALPEGLSCTVVSMSEADREERKNFIPPAGRCSEDLIYILYTSGSTGQPKGVMLKHRSINNLMAFMSDRMAGVEGAVLCSTNMIFDIFISESLLPLAMGRCVVLADDEQMRLPWELAGLAEENDVRIMQFTPSRLQMCLENHAFFQAAGRSRLTILVGEIFTDSLLHRLQSTGCSGIYNMYGPTEAAVYVTMADVTGKEHATIGKPMYNCRVYILDEDRKTVMPTAVGEMYLAGECLALGYANRQDLTDQCFVEDPFFPGQKMYKTGDRARLLEDGSIEFIGRLDAQIKIDGQRVEPAEVTGKILESGMVSSAATVAVEYGSGFKKLRTFVTPKEGRELTKEEILGWLKGQLPSHMLPKELYIWKELPGTPSGKADLKKLSGLSEAECEALELTLKLPEEKTVPAAEMTPNQHNPEAEPKWDKKSCGEEKESGIDVEEALDNLWRRVLGRESVDHTASFFEQGGSSLAALTLLGNYFNEGWTLTLAQFYDHPSIEEQKRLICGSSLTVEPVREAVSAALPAVSKIPAACAKPEIKPVFLTGATGFLGAHLVKELLDAGYGQILCAVRGERPQERLDEILSWYFGNGWLSGQKRKIRAVSADITLEHMGMDAKTYEELSGRICAVVHAAADVRHYDSQGGLKETNCRGTSEAAALARAAGAKLLHISTASICGEYLKADPARKQKFTEDDLDIGQNWKDNVYVESKFLAERIVLDAAKDGFETWIFRVGRLAGRSTDGVFQKNPDSNAFYGMIQGLKCLERFPASMTGLSLEITAVDECARAIAALSRAPAGIYHVFQPRQVTLRDLIIWLKGSCEETDEAGFDRHLLEKMQNGHLAELTPLLNQYNRLRVAVPTIEADCEKTVKELGKCGFVWKAPDLHMLLRSFSERTD